MQRYSTPVRLPNAFGRSPHILCNSASADRAPGELPPGSGQRRADLGRPPIRGVDQPFRHQQQDREDQGIDHRDRDNAHAKATEMLAEIRARQIFQTGNDRIERRGTSSAKCPAGLSGRSGSSGQADRHRRDPAPVTEWTNSSGINCGIASLRTAGTLAEISDTELRRSPFRAPSSGAIPKKHRPGRWAREVGV